MLLDLSGEPLVVDVPTQSTDKDGSGVELSGLLSLGDGRDGSGGFVLGRFDGGGFDDRGRFFRGVERVDGGVLGGDDVFGGSRLGFVEKVGARVKVPRSAGFWKGRNGGRVRPRC